MSYNNKRKRKITMKFKKIIISITSLLLLTGLSISTGHASKTPTSVNNINSRLTMSINRTATSKSINHQRKPGININQTSAKDRKRNRNDRHYHRPKIKHYSHNNNSKRVKYNFKNPHYKSHNAYNILNGKSINHFRVGLNTHQANVYLPRFHYLRSIPKFGRFPQSLTIVPSGHYAYIGFSSYRNGYMRAIRMNLHNGRTKLGPYFRGGHGQAMAYNPHNKTLWTIYRNQHSNIVTNADDDDAGQINNGSFIKINSNTLRPTYHRSFELGRHKIDFLGNTLCFGPDGNAYNVERILGYNGSRKNYQRHMLVFYRGIIGPKNCQFQRIEALRWAPGDVIESLGYNPRNHKLYAESNEPNAILSVNADQLTNNQARRKDVKLAKIRTKQEPEGISFDKYGYCYIALSDPDEIIKSNRPFIKF